MNNKYALIKDGVVINTIDWGGPDEEPVDFGEGVTYVVVPDNYDNFPSTGWLYDGEKFIAPPLTQEEIDSIKVVAIANNIATKQAMMDEASQQIGVLRDAVDLDMATDDETRLLPLWKKYRVLLNRIDANTPDTIAWPEKPV